MLFIWSQAVNRKWLFLLISAFLHASNSSSSDVRQNTLQKNESFVQWPYFASGRFLPSNRFFGSGAIFCPGAIQQQLLSQGSLWRNQIFSQICPAPKKILYRVLQTPLFSIYLTFIQQCSALTRLSIHQSNSLENYKTLPCTKKCFGVWTNSIVRSPPKLQLVAFQRAQTSTKTRWRVTTLATSASFWAKRPLSTSATHYQINSRYIKMR